MKFILDQEKKTLINEIEKIKEEAHDHYIMNSDFLWKDFLKIFNKINSLNLKRLNINDLKELYSQYKRVATL